MFWKKMMKIKILVLTKRRPTLTDWKLNDGKCTYVHSASANFVTLMPSRGAPELRLGRNPKVFLNYHKAMLHNRWKQNTKLTYNDITVNVRCRKQNFLIYTFPRCLQDLIVTWYHLSCNNIYYFIQILTLLYIISFNLLNLRMGSLHAWVSNKAINNNNYQNHKSNVNGHVWVCRGFAKCRVIS